MLVTAGGSRSCKNRSQEDFVRAGKQSKQRYKGDLRKMGGGGQKAKDQARWSGSLGINRLRSCRGWIQFVASLRNRTERRMERTILEGMQERSVF